MWKYHCWQCGADSRTPSRVIACQSCGSPVDRTPTLEPTQEPEAEPYRAAPIRNYGAEYMATGLISDHAGTDMLIGLLTTIQDGCEESTALAALTHLLDRADARGRAAWHAAQKAAKAALEAPPSAERPAPWGDHARRAWRNGGFS